MDEIVERCSELGAKRTRAVVRRLAESHILHRSDRTPLAKEQAMATFDSWNPAAGFFHDAAKDVHFRDPRLFGTPPPRAVRRPLPVKRYPGAAAVVLPNPPVSGEFPRVLLSRRTWRRFGNEPVTLGHTATLLRLTAGMHQFVATRTEGRLALRTSPSAGARHPIEVYLLALRVKGLARGLYHYASDLHTLERLRRGVKQGGVRRYLPTQEAYEQAAAVVFFSARFTQVIGRYPYARAYRAAFVEAGHLCQTLCLTATWLGLAPFCSMALSDRHLEHDFGIDGVSESVLYAAGIGQRPSDPADAAAPPGVSAARPVLNPVFTRVDRR
jgi:SagB-type dehydrogenase family enzyme